MNSASSRAGCTTSDTMFTTTFLGHPMAAAATLAKLLLSADDQKLASVTVAAGAKTTLDCTGNSHAAVRKQDARPSVVSSGTGNRVRQALSEQILPS